LHNFEIASTGIALAMTWRNFLIRVTIVSPNHALRIGLREMLAEHPNIRVTGEAATLNEVNENETEVARACLGLFCARMRN
jgi:DNA-binding NarL/FixJ family response regulator